MTQLVVVLRASTTKLSGNRTASVFGQSVTYTVNVARLGGAAATPIGTVQLQVDGVVTGSATLNAGRATFTTSTLTGGNHSVVAMYPGSAVFASSTGPAVGLAVTQGVSRTVVSSSRSPALRGTNVVLTATVSATGAAVGTPTGTVQLRIDGVLGAPVAVSAAGRAVFATTTLAVGLHTVVAVYNGSAGFLASTSASINQNIR